MKIGTLCKVIAHDSHYPERNKRGNNMKIGNLIYYRCDKKEWGFIVAEYRNQWLVHWHDGDTAWILKSRIALLEVQ